MYRIIICDNDSQSIDFMEEMVLKSGLQKDEVIFYKYVSGEALVQAMDKIENCDLLILDMKLEGIDGHETAARFRKAFPYTTLVFWSGECQPTVESFKATPFRYLLKSYPYEQMLSEMRIVIAEVQSKSKEPLIVGRYYYNIVRLRPSDILYIENTKHGSILHVHPDRKQYEFENNLTTKEKLKDLSVKLEDYGFIYAHNSYLVNLKYIVKMLSQGEIKLIDGTLLSVSRSRLKEVRCALSDELGRKYTS